MHKDVFQQLTGREPDSHKYQFGHVLIIGGAPGMVGAPFLSGKAALRAGTGLVTIASEKAVIDKLETRTEEIMTFTIPDSEPVVAVKQFVYERKVSVLVIGPGMSSRSADLIRGIIGSIDVPMVIDGGGLSALQGHLELLEHSPSKDIVLTPHLGEFQRLVIEDLPPERVKLKPIATEFAEHHSVTLVLKGEPTYVAHPDGITYENPTGNPGLATAGSGDVLTGILGGIMAQGIELNKAIDAAVYLHGLAGDLATEDKTQPGMIASDIIEFLPKAYKTIQARDAF